MVILGASMVGMAAADELQQTGYRCTIPETLGRPGGRNFTARRGTQVVEDTGPNGRTVQTCQFDDGLHMNLGPVRLHFHHPRVMHYCKAFGGQAMPRYRIGNDINTSIAELLSKAIQQKALDAELNPDERKKCSDCCAVLATCHQTPAARWAARRPARVHVTPDGTGQSPLLGSAALQHLASAIPTTPSRRCGTRPMGTSARVALWRARILILSRSKAKVVAWQCGTPWSAPARTHAPTSACWRPMAATL